MQKVVPPVAFVMLSTMVRHGLTQLLWEMMLLVIWESTLAVSLVRVVGSWTWTSDANASSVAGSVVNAGCVVTASVVVVLAADVVAACEVV
jgi:hypothetical protein